MAGCQLAQLATLFALWQVATSSQALAFLSGWPSQIWGYLVKMQQDGSLVHDAGVTCMETLMGFRFGNVIGTVFGLSLWYSRFLSKVMQPFIVALGSIPIVALTPIVIIGVHGGIATGSVVFLLFACSALGQIVQAIIAARWRQAAGCIGLVVRLMCVGVCVPERSLGALLIGTVLAGIGQGISFRAGLGEIASAAPAHRRAGVTSSFLVVL